MSYTFELDGSPVMPDNRSDWNFGYTRNPGQIFFRKEINGEFIFQGDDYDTIMASSECDILSLEIFCEGDSVWTGEFKFPYDFEIDEDSCFLKGTPKVVDEYSCIMDQYETEWFYDVIFIAAAGVNADVVPCVGGAALATIQNGHTIFEYLDRIINLGQLMDCNLTLSSSFFWRDDFPNGDNYAAAYGITNYVTGATNRLEYIYLYDNTRIRVDLAGAACDATELLFDWKFGFQLFESLLRGRFNAYWYIDSAGDFRIEHISFFLNGFANSEFGDSVIDLTTLLAPQTGLSYAYRRNKYQYLTDELFDQERWEWMHYIGTEGGVLHGADFAGDPIYYGANAYEKSDCVPGDFKEKVITTPNFWSDIEWATGLAAPASFIDCLGWCMCDILITGPPNTVNCEVGLITGVNNINGHCSTANLMENYFTWDRIFLTGTMNGSDATPVTVFDSAIKKVLQDEIQFPLCCEGLFNPLKGITTEMGVGEIHSAVLDQISLTVELLYD